MGNPLYSPVNRLGEATLHLGGTAATHPKFPLAHLHDLRAGTLWRRSGTGNVSIYADFKNNISVDTVALINHNLLPGTDVRLLGAPNGGNYEELADLSPLLEHPKFFVKFTRGSWYYFALQCTNVLQADPPSIGQWWLGDGYELSRNAAWGVAEGVDYRSSELVAHTGATSSYHISENEFFDGDMGQLTEEERDELRLLFERVKGKAGRFLFAPSAAHPRAFIGRLVEGRYQSRNVSVNRYAGLALRVAEDPWGAPAV